MSMPWDPNYTPTSADQELIDKIQGQLGQLSSTATTPTAGPVPATPSEPEVAHPESTGPESPAPATPVGGISDIAREAATAAVGELIPTLVTEIKNALPPDVPAQIDANDLLKASARNRAVRTFFGGLVVTILWALVNVVGSATGVNWFSKEGWISVGILAGGAVVNAVVSYILRVFKPPPLAQVPGGG